MAGPARRRHDRGRARIPKRSGIAQRGFRARRGHRFDRGPRSLASVLRGPRGLRRASLEWRADRAASVRLRRSARAHGGSGGRRRALRPRGLRGAEPSRPGRAGRGAPQGGGRVPARRGLQECRGGTPGRCAPAGGARPGMEPALRPGSRPRGRRGVRSRRPRTGARVLPRGDDFGRRGSCAGREGGRPRARARGLRHGRVDFRRPWPREIRGSPHGRRRRVSRSGSPTGRTPSGKPPGRAG